MRQLLDLRPSLLDGQVGSRKSTSVRGAMTLARSRPGEMTSSMSSRSSVVQRLLRSHKTAQLSHRRCLPRRFWIPSEQPDGGIRGQKPDERARDLARASTGPASAKNVSTRAGRAFGTSSPRTSDRYAITTVTPMNIRLPATPGGNPIDSSHGVALGRYPGRAEASGQEPSERHPTCTAARNGSGLLTRFFSRRPCPPCVAARCSLVIHAGSRGPFPQPQRIHRSGVNSSTTPILVSSSPRVPGYADACPLDWGSSALFPHGLGPAPGAHHRPHPGPAAPLFQGVRGWVMTGMVGVMVMVYRGCWSL